MRAYGSISPRFWTGKTGRQIRALGAEAQVIAMYLMTCPNSTMTGLYYIPICTLSHETGVPIEGAWKGLRSLEEIDFCTYEAQNEVVFVHKLARFQVGKELRPSDNKVKGIAAVLEPYLESELFHNFWELYADAYSLRDVLKSPSEGASKGLRPVTVTVTETETGTERETGRARDVVRELAERIWQMQEDLREELKESGIGRQTRSLSVMHPAKLELVSRISETLSAGGTAEDASEDCQHVLAVLGAEARQKNSLRWLDGGHWKADRYATSLSLEIGESMQSTSQAVGHNVPSDIDNAPIDPLETPLTPCPRGPGDPF